MIAVAQTPTKQSGVLQTAVPGASPYVWTNSGPSNQVVMLGGGTVATIEVAQDGVTYLVTGLLAGAFILQPAGKLRVTYTIIPTFLNAVNF